MDYHGLEVRTPSHLSKQVSEIQRLQERIEVASCALVIQSNHANFLLGIITGKTGQQSVL